MSLLIHGDGDAMDHDGGYRCEICMDADSQGRYLCSRCERRYCSLNCFKSEKHQTCSESFYAKQVKESMGVLGGGGGGGVAGDKDKLKLISVLDQYKGNKDDDDWKYEAPLNYNKIEDGLSLQREDLDEQDRELTMEEEKELEELIENASLEKLWKLMTPDEQKNFEKLVKSGKYEIID